MIQKTLLILLSAILVSACQPKESDKLTPPSENTTSPKPQAQTEQNQNPTVNANNQASTQTSNTRQLGNASSLTATSSSLTGTITGFSTKKTEQGLQIDMSADVLFDFDKADIKPDALPALQKVADIIKTEAKGNVVITGHTDSKGDDAYNQKLSTDRATTVKNWLAGQGLTQQFEVIGKGESEPVAQNENSDGSDNPEGRAKNRRVSILIKNS